MGANLTFSEQSLVAKALLERPDSVLFVTSQLRPRELKMADGLRRMGWTVGLLYYKWTPFDPDSYFDFAIEATSAQEAHAMAKHLSPRVTHVFSGAIDDCIMAFCRDKPSPVVIDLNDVFAPSLFDYCHERFEPTREALALADGFCARDLQVKSAEKADRFRLPRNMLLFPEYCWTTEIPDVSLKYPEDEVHIVSVGTFSLETQGMYDSCYLQLTKLLVAQGIHLHIYPHWAYRRDHMGSPHANFEKDFAEFIALEKTTPYLHLYDSLPLDALARVLPEYDFGIVSGGCEAFGQKLRFYHPAYLETCYSGRISDYLEAGLPVLVNDEVKFDFWLLKRYGVCMDLKDVLRPGFKQKLLERKRDPAARRDMERAIEKLSVAANSGRLAAFYTKLMKASPQAAPVVQQIELPALAARNPRTPYALLGKGKRAIRWVSPRLAKILLPYRASRLFQVRLHNALQELERANSGIDRSTRDCQTLSEQLALLQGVNEALTAENAATLAAAEFAEQKRARAAIQHADLQSRLHEVEKEKADLAVAIVAMQEQYESLKEKADAGQEQCNLLRTMVEGLEREKIAQRGDIDALRSTVEGLERDKVSQRSAVDAFHSIVEGLEREKMAQRSDIDAFRSLALGLQNEKDVLKEHVQGVDSELAVTRTRLLEIEAEKVALASQVTTQEQVNAQLTYQVHVLSNEKFVLQQEAEWGRLPMNEVAGVLNWSELLNDAERANGFADLVRMVGLFSGESGVAGTPSACWDLLATKNYDQLLSSGYRNFKRTIGNNYFNFLVQAGDPQISAAEERLSPDVVSECRAQAHALPDDPDFPAADPATYRYFVLLLWAYARSIDHAGCAGRLVEPEEGNPFLVRCEDRDVSQDLANSLIEYHAICEGADMSAVKTVLEIGGGYGRTAYVMLALNQHIQVTMVDIPPALYIAQRYLSSVFKDRRVFRVRNFASYEEVREEMEAASIVFLMPHQLALMPTGKFDVALNISSFGEMAREQVNWYFAQLERVTTGVFYSKQWKISNNVFDDVVLREEDYPYPSRWKRLYSRPGRIQSDFFESLHQVSAS